MSQPDAISKLIKKLFPLPARLTLKGDVHELRRALALTVLLLIISATTWFWFLCLTALYLIWHFDILINVCFGFFVSIMMALQVFGFYRYANLRVTSMLFSLSYFLMVLTLVLMSGGYHSPNLVVLMSCPVIAFRVGGKDEGIMNAIFIGLTGFALVIIDKLGVVVANYLLGMDEGLFFSIAWVVTLSTIASCLVTYDMED